MPPTEVLATQASVAPGKSRPSQRTSTASKWKRTFDSLAVPEFRYLFFGLLFMMSGIQMQALARSYLVFDITSSPLILGIVSGGNAIPMLTLSLFGGAIADRMNRKRVIQVTQGIAGAMALVVAIAIATDTIRWYHLLLSSVMQGAIFSFMMPARQAIIPQLVGKERLSNAMALNAAGMSVATLVAPAIGGVLYGLIGPDGVYYLISGFGFTAVLLTTMIKMSGGSAPAKSRGPVIGDIKEGLAYIRVSPLVMVLLVMGLATTLLAMPFRQLIPVFVVDVYRRGPESFGLIFIVNGLGSLAGSIFVAGLGKWRRGMLLIGGSILSGIGLLLISLIPIYYVAVVIMLLLGLGDAARRTLNQALIMEITEDQYRGRVMSVFMMNFGLMPLGVLPAGVMAEFFGGQIAIGVLAVLLLLTTTVIFVSQKRLREFQ